MEKQTNLSINQLNQLLTTVVNSILKKKFRVTIKYYTKTIVINTCGNTFKIYDLTSFNEFKESIEKFIK